MQCLFRHDHVGGTASLAELKTHVKILTTLMEASDFPSLEMTGLEY